MQAQQVQRTVVVGVDGSESALTAVRWGAREAVRRRLPLRLVHAFSWPNTRHFGDPGLGFDYQEVLLRAAHEQVSAAADAAAAAAPGVELEQQVEAGYPIPMLEAESRRAQLLVLGTRGLGGVTGLVLGSVTVALAACAACPVVVVRGSEPLDALAGDRLCLWRRRCAPGTGDCGTRLVGLGPPSSDGSSARLGRRRGSRTFGVGRAPGGLG
jgi:nucleotide-binding universal stress UspA family protein